MHFIRKEVKTAFVSQFDLKGSSRPTSLVRHSRSTKTEELNENISYSSQTHSPFTIGLMLRLPIAKHDSRFASCNRFEWFRSYFGQACSVNLPGLNFLGQNVERKALPQSCNAPNRRQRLHNCSFIHVLPCDSGRIVGSCSVWKRRYNVHRTQSTPKLVAQSMQKSKEINRNFSNAFDGSFA